MSLSPWILLGFELLPATRALMTGDCSYEQWGIVLNYHVVVNTKPVSMFCLSLWNRLGGSSMDAIKSPLTLLVAVSPVILKSLPIYTLPNRDLKSVWLNTVIIHHFAADPDIYYICYIIMKTITTVYYICIYGICSCCWLKKQETYHRLTFCSWMVILHKSQHCIRCLHKETRKIYNLEREYI